MRGLAADGRTRLVTACRLAEKACDQGLRVAVRTAGPAQTAELDDLMWTFSDRSFVPHGVWPAEPDFAAAIRDAARGVINDDLDLPGLQEPNRFVPDDDWLLWDFHSQKIRGKHVESARK